MAERKKGRISAWALALLLTPIGLYLAAGGFSLAALGGSWYYIAAGLATLATVFFLFRGDKRAVICFSALLIVTLVWSLWEAGLDGWALAPRLIGPLVLGLLFLTPGVRKFTGHANAWWMGGPIVAALLVFAAAVVSAQLAMPNLEPARAAARADAPSEWRVWGRTLAGDRYVPLSEINASTVDQLQVAWRYQPESGSAGGAATPLMANGRVYTCLSGHRVAALDAETGRELWVFDPQLDMSQLNFAVCRGLAYAETPEAQVCKSRIVWGVADMRLMAIDAETGQACEDFGESGSVDLKQGLGEYGRGVVMNTSPPTIVNGVAVIGHFVSDTASPETPSGVVRGYDVTTGALRWAFDAGRPDHTGAPAPGETYTHNAPNAWSIFAGDEDLGLVFLPMGNSAPDNYGAGRSESIERFSSALVAIDVASGAVRWSFQTVRHDIWDYDLATPPIAVDLNTANGSVPALIVPTKRGQIFVLDRRTGAPIDAVEERAVPQGALGEDYTAPTQPYTTGFPSLAGDALRERDMWGITPLDQMWCRTQFRRARYDGEFTPPAAPASVQYPGSTGAINWRSVSVDPEQGFVAVTTMHVADYNSVISRDEFDSRPSAGGFLEALSTYPQLGAPFAMTRPNFMSPLFAPCQEPPYGRLAVLDLNTRALRWSVPLGTAAGVGPLGLQSHLPILMGTPNFAAPTLTAGGLVFVAGAMDGILRAYDAGSGREVWSIRAPSSAPPMSFSAPESGRQILLISSGAQRGGEGRGGIGSGLIALALPQEAGAPAGGQ